MRSLLAVIGGGAAGIAAYDTHSLALGIAFAAVMARIIYREILEK